MLHSQVLLRQRPGSQNESNVAIIAQLTFPHDPHKAAIEVRFCVHDPKKDGMDGGKSR